MALQHLAHIIHIRGCVGEELVVSLAEIVQPGLTIRSRQETVAGALAVAGKLIFAVETLAWQSAMLGYAEAALH